MANLILIPSLNGINVDIHVHIELVAKAYNLDVRSVDQLTAKFFACLRTANNSPRQQVINTFTLLIALVEFDRNADEYKNRKQDNNQRNNFIECNVVTLSDYHQNSGKVVNKTLFDLFLESSSKLYKETEDRWRRQVFQMEPMYPEDVYRYTRNNDTINPALTNVESSLLNSLRTYVYEPCDGTPKYWFWDDYTRVVELAGNIE